MTHLNFFGHHLIYKMGQKNNFAIIKFIKGSSEKTLLS